MLTNKITPGTWVGQGGQNMRAHKKSASWVTPNWAKSIERREGGWKEEKEER